MLAKKRLKAQQNVDLTEQVAISKPQRGERADTSALERRTQIRTRKPREEEEVSLGGRTLEASHELFAFSEVLAFMKSSLVDWDSNSCVGEIFTIDELRYCDVDFEFLG